jgi:hypothetical protein
MQFGIKPEFGISIIPALIYLALKINSSIFLAKKADSGRHTMNDVISDARWRK